MRLLIVTDTLDVDDPVRGYFHRWIEELALHAKSIRIITAKEGYHTLPKNVTVHSLGGEHKRRRLSRVLRYLWFSIRHIRSFDSVFVFHTPSYIVTTGWWWKLWKKKVGIWYSLGEPTAMLQIARPFCAYIFTPTTYGYYGGGDIKQVVGHGIDTARFKPILRPRHDGTFRMVTVGAISSVRDYTTLIRAISHLKESVETPFSLSIAGAPKAGEEEFAEEMRKFAHSFGLSDRVTFMGPVKNEDIVKLHQQSDLYISVGTLPGVEKALIEAAATGLPILSSNESFKEHARDYANFVFFEQGDDMALAERIRHAMLMTYDARHALGQVFRNVAVTHHSIDGLAKAITHCYQHD